MREPCTLRRPGVNCRVAVGPHQHLAGRIFLKLGTRLIPLRIRKRLCIMYQLGMKWHCPGELASILPHPGSHIRFFANPSLNLRRFLVDCVEFLWITSSFLKNCWLQKRVLSLRTLGRGNPATGTLLANQVS